MIFNRFLVLAIIAFSGYNAGVSILLTTSASALRSRCHPGISEDTTAPTHISRTICPPIVNSLHIALSHLISDKHDNHPSSLLGSHTSLYTFFRISGHITRCLSDLPLMPSKPENISNPLMFRKSGKVHVSLMSLRLSMSESDAIMDLSDKP